MLWTTAWLSTPAFPRLAWAYVLPQVLVKSKASQAPPRYPDLLHQIPMGGAWWSPVAHPGFRCFAWISGVSLFGTCGPILTEKPVFTHAGLSHSLFQHVWHFPTLRGHERGLLAAEKHGVVCVTWHAWHSFFLLVLYAPNNLLSIIYVPTWWTCSQSWALQGLRPSGYGCGGNRKWCFAVEFLWPLALEGWLHVQLFLAETWEPDSSSYSKAHSCVFWVSCSHTSLQVHFPSLSQIISLLTIKRWTCKLYS